jgi:hypothetical protein
MNRKLSNGVLHLIAIALVVVALAPTMRGDNADNATVATDASGSQSVSAPIVVAQGRCFNGRCF